MKHFLGLLDLQPAKLEQLVVLAGRLKAGKDADAARVIKDRILAMVFFNPSLRTRASFEAAMLRFGGHAIVLSPGGDIWRIEHRNGAVMNAECAEHIREAAPVLGRYCDVLGVRTFARMANAAEDAADAIMQNFAAFSGVPTISLESAIEHPCQGLADQMTLTEKLGRTQGKRFVLSWAPHIKGLPMAVPHSAILAAAAAGMHVTIAHPPGYELGARFVETARTWCRQAGTSLVVTDQQRAACHEADAIYVKSWGSPTLYGKPDAQLADFHAHADWMVGLDHLCKATTILMHCLPVRRNVVIADAALDDPRAVVVDQAENRLWAQAAVLCELLSRPKEEKIN
jgi:N-acetylornithine carbamoyltransferase